MGDDERSDLLNRENKQANAHASDDDDTVSDDDIEVRQRVG